MHQRSYLCGTSKATYDAVIEKPRPAPRVKRDPGTARLRTVLHVPGIPRHTRGYRVLVRLAGGREALLCLGSTADEALARARRLAGASHPDAVAVLLQEWVGGSASGAWRDVRRPRLVGQPLAGRRRRRSA